ncbi:phasin family protein [Rhodospirillum centenum]|nr:phasin family protein [Rhodospirillum centenum]
MAAQNQTDARTSAGTSQADTPRAGQSPQRDGGDTRRDTASRQETEDRRTAETARNDSAEALDKTRRTAREVADRVADTGRDLADGGATIAQRNTETTRTAVRSATDAGSSVLRQVSEQMNRMVDLSTPEARDAVERTSRNMRVVARCGTAVAERSQPIVQELVAYSQQAAQVQLDALNRISRARSPVELAAAQGEYLRTGLELWFRSGRRIGEEMLRLGEQVEQVIREEERAEEPRTGTAG